MITNQDWLATATPEGWLATQPTTVTRVLAYLLDGPLTLEELIEIRAAEDREQYGPDFHYSDVLVESALDRAAALVEYTADGRVHLAEAHRHAVELAARRYARHHAKDNKS